MVPKPIEPKNFPKRAPTGSTSNGRRNFTIPKKNCALEEEEKEGEKDFTKTTQKKQEGRERKEKKEKLCVFNVGVGRA